MAAKVKAATTAVKLSKSSQEISSLSSSSRVEAAAKVNNRWREKLAKYKAELSKGVWGYWELGLWKPLAISARHRAKLRREDLLAGEDWNYDPPRKAMRDVGKGHICDRISAQKRANTAELMKKISQMLLDYKKRRWEKKMKEEEGKDRRGVTTAQDVEEIGRVVEEELQMDKINLSNKTPTPVKENKQKRTKKHKMR